MVSNNVLVVLNVLVSGFIFTKTYPPSKRVSLKSNGQQLTFISASVGLVFFVSVYFLYPLFVDMGSAGNGGESEGVGEGVLISSNRLRDSSFFTFAIAVSLFSLSVVLKAITNLMFSDFVRNKIGRDLMGAMLRENVHQALSSLFSRLHWYSYKYSQYMAWHLVKSDGMEEFFFDIMTKPSGGSCMIVVESRKVVIGRIVDIPSPQAPPEEKYIKVSPFITGYLCKDRLGFHVTSDYTPHIEEKLKGVGHYNYGFDMVLPISSISYVREFDKEYFDANHSHKKCLCGDDVYNPSS